MSGAARRPLVRRSHPFQKTPRSLAHAREHHCAHKKNEHHSHNSQTLRVQMCERIDGSTSSSSCHQDIITFLERWVEFRQSVNHLPHRQHRPITPSRTGAHTCHSDFARHLQPACTGSSKARDERELFGSTEGADDACSALRELTTHALLTPMSHSPACEEDMSKGFAKDMRRILRQENPACDLDRRGKEHARTSGAET